ncbi:N-acetyltransferase [Eubacteriales bacterium OttesenSCG-928-M02]|nr:N-acetyltransferase [Eubacteriales bacterium OttesenSCG-928-M02]
MIRHATRDDFPAIKNVYNIAKKQMRQAGNTVQWQGDYPSYDMMAADMAAGALYVLEQDGRIHGAFVFLMGEDPTYAYIENGAWPNDAPYGTIHRIASDGTIKGVFQSCLSHCKTLSDHIRIDTHESNKAMQYLIEKSGFVKCGIIYVADGTPRIAYQYSAPVK